MFRNPVEYLNNPPRAASSVDAAFLDVLDNLKASYRPGTIGVFLSFRDGKWFAQGASGSLIVVDNYVARGPESPPCDTVGQALRYIPGLGHVQAMDAAEEAVVTDLLKIIIQSLYTRQLRISTIPHDTRYCKVVFTHHYTWTSDSANPQISSFYVKPYVYLSEDRSPSVRGTPMSIRGGTVEEALLGVAAALY